MTKTFIVTGASRGIGLAIAKYLAQDGHNVVVSARSQSPLEQLRDEHPSQIRIITGDMADLSLGKRTVDLAKKEFGQLHGVVVNHGVLEPVERIAKWNTEEWKHHFDINFFSAISLLEAAVPTLRESQGRVVLTSSGAATNPYSTWGAYCASKAALRSLGQTLAVEEKDITTISVVPGVVDTEMQRSLRDVHLSKMDEKDQQKFTSAHQEGKLLKPEQPGNVMARLVVGAPKELSGQSERWNSSTFAAFQDS